MVPSYILTFSHCISINCKLHYPCVMLDAPIAKAHMTSNRQITLPRNVIEKIGAKEGDYILFFEEEGRIYVEAGEVLSRRRRKED